MRSWIHHSPVTIIIGIVVIFVGILILALMKIPVIVGTLMGTGIALFASGVNDYLKYLGSTTELGCPEDVCLELEPLGNLYRVYLRIKNRGPVSVKDAMALLTLNNGHVLNQNSAAMGYTISRVVEEPLPWEQKGRNEVLIQGSSRFLLPVYEKAILISPRVTARLFLADIIPCKEKDYEFKVCFFNDGPVEPIFVADVVPSESMKVRETFQQYRVCLPFGDGRMREIPIEVVVYGEGLRGPFRVCLDVSLDGLRSILKGSVDVDKVFKVRVGC